ncbi:MAG: hypothetical protein AAF570_21190, partial [Bacteroidota bacterium]
MKLRKYILLVPALMLFLSVSAQKTQDKVVLKDGSVIQGTITEYITTSHIRIKTEEGKVHEYPAVDVKRTRFNGVKNVAVKSSGYFNNTSFGLLFGGNAYYDSPVYPSIRMVNGYKFKDRFWTGLGTGIEFFQGRTWIPLYADLRYDFLKGDVSPYVQAIGGYNFRPDPNAGVYQPWGYNYENDKGGIMTGVSLGIRNF